MRLLILALAACVFTVISIQPSQARRGGSETQQLHFVAPTTIPGAEGKTLSLCHLSTKNHVFGIGFWRSTDGYALSDNKCEGEQYFPFTGAQFAEAQEQGLIDKGIPAEPKMTMNMILSGFSGLGILAVLVLLAGFKFISSRRRSNLRRGRDGRCVGVSQGRAGCDVPRGAFRRRCRGLRSHADSKSGAGPDREGIYRK